MFLVRRSPGRRPSPSTAGRCRGSSNLQPPTQTQNHVGFAGFKNIYMSIWLDTKFSAKNASFFVKIDNEISKRKIAKLCAIFFFVIRIIKLFFFLPLLGSDNAVINY